jgi:phosphatidylserine decarboxylase
LDSQTVTEHETPPLPAAGIAARIAGILRIATEGVPVTVGALAAGVVVLILGFAWPGAIVIMVAAAVGAFFRDPERAATCSATAIVSGADGRVTAIAEESLPGGASSELYRRVSVFMSPFNVHVNRAPVGGKIVAITHTPGKFSAAFRDEASEYNERNLMVLTDASGRRHGMVQIAGYLARRIVCRVHPMESVARGERIGMIMFGSRVDHFMPLEYQVTINVGDRVRAGESVIGRLSDEA